MFLDSSAIVEYFLEGPQVEKVLAAISEAETPFHTFPTVLFESASVLATRRNISVEETLALIEDFLAQLSATVSTIDHHTAQLALEAHSRYGKGRHPAKLNFGDCFSYAGAMQCGFPLLYIGEDFARTDLARNLFRPSFPSGLRPSVANRLACGRRP